MAALFKPSRSSQLRIAFLPLQETMAWLEQFEPLASHEQLEPIAPIDRHEFGYPPRAVRQCWREPKEIDGAVQMTQNLVDMIPPVASHPSNTCSTSMPHNHGHPPFLVLKVGCLEEQVMRYVMSVQGDMRLLVARGG